MSPQGSKRARVHRLGINCLQNPNINWLCKNHDDDKPYTLQGVENLTPRLVLRNPRPEKELGAAKPYTLRVVGRARLCEPQQVRQKGRSYKRPELRSNMRPRTEVISDPSSTPDSAKPGIHGKGGQRLAL